MRRLLNKLRRKPRTNASQAEPDNEWLAIRRPGLILVQRNGHPFACFADHKALSAERSYQCFCAQKGINPKETTP